MTTGQPSTVAGQLFLISDFPAVPLGSSADLRSSNISGTIDKVVQPNLPNEKSFCDLVGSTAPQSESIQYKEVFMIEVIEKFIYGIIDIEELRKLIPQQCNIKVFYITCKDGYSYLMCILIYDSRFKVNEKTTKALAWISFPNLLPIYFVKECMISLASTVGDFPKSITMDIENEVNGEVRMEEIHIKYDYVSFYCDACKMQGTIPKRSTINSVQEATNYQRESIDKPSEQVESSKDWVLQNFGRRETPTQRKDVIPISEKIHGENVTIQVVNKPLVCLQSSELPGSSEVNLEKDEEENKALCAASDPVEERDDEIIEDNSKALIAIPHQEVDALPITMVSHAKQISSQQLDSKNSHLIEYEHEGDVELVESLSQAIVECPRVVQLDENQLVHMESPNRVIILVPLFINFLTATPPKFSKTSAIQNLDPKTQASLPSLCLLPAATTIASSSSKELHRRNHPKPPKPRPKATGNDPISMFSDEPTTTTANHRTPTHHRFVSLLFSGSHETRPNHHPKPHRKTPSHHHSQSPIHSCNYLSSKPVTREL
ncbi:hypothetical protein H5410_045634 [Solanum commersonii]|uniref:DUF4283 domain-containing protein n=1 Tax=Solanum commersonii TaxID=4109 RepID=A0A9J5XE84_SOLCO|nr:hypothetical protein H5410_045634 [Solanum commersonii]